MEPNDRTALLLIIGRQTVRIASLEAALREMSAQLQAVRVAQEAAPASNEDAEG